MAQRNDTSLFAGCHPLGTSQYTTESERLKHNQGFLLSLPPFRPPLTGGLDFFPRFVTSSETTQFDSLEDSNESMRIFLRKNIQEIPISIDSNSHVDLPDRSEKLQNEILQPLGIYSKIQPVISKPNMFLSLNNPDRSAYSTVPASSSSPTIFARNPAAPTDFRTALLAPIPCHARRGQAQPGTSPGMPQSYAAHLISPLFSPPPTPSTSTESSCTRPRGGPAVTGLCPASAAPRISVENLLG